MIGYQLGLQNGVKLVYANTVSEKRVYLNLLSNLRLKRHSGLVSVIVFHFNLFNSTVAGLKIILYTVCFTDLGNLNCLRSFDFNLESIFAPAPATSKIDSKVIILPPEI